jgi:hypothetical protein
MYPACTYYIIRSPHLSLDLWPALHSGLHDHHHSGDRVRATGFGCAALGWSEVGLDPSYYTGPVITPAAAVSSVAPTNNVNIHYTHCTTGPLFPAAVIFPTTGAQKLLLHRLHYAQVSAAAEQRRDSGARVLVYDGCGDGGGDLEENDFFGAETPRQLLPAFDRSPATNQIRQHGRRQPVPPSCPYKYIYTYIFYIIILYISTRTYV